MKNYSFTDECTLAQKSTDLSHDSNRIGGIDSKGVQEHVEVITFVANFSALWRLEADGCRTPYAAFDNDLWAKDLCLVGLRPFIPESDSNHCLLTTRFDEACLRIGSASIACLHPQHLKKSRDALKRISLNLQISRKDVKLQSWVKDALRGGEKSVDIWHDDTDIGATFIGSTSQYRGDLTVHVNFPLDLGYVMCVSFNGKVVIADNLLKTQQRFSHCPIWI